MEFKKWITGLGYKLEIQTDGTLDNPVYTNISDICLSTAEAFNETLDTFNTLASAMTSSVKTAIDPEFTLTAKGDKANPGMRALLSTIWLTGEEAVKMVRLTNTWAREVVTFPATITGYNPTFETQTVVEVPWSLKPYDGSQVTVSEVETTAPAISTYSPADDATGVSVDTALVITFDENVLKGVGDIKIYASLDDSLIESINVQKSGVSISGAVVTATRSVSLSAGAEYYVQIDEGAFTDLVGNSFAGISDKTTWSFTTAA